jgi:hypothetical protein
MVFELVANTLSAMTIGYATGVLVSVLALAQAHILVELPLQVKLPYDQIIILGILILVSLVFGARFGT